jgi:hypothetical protein
MAKFDHRNDIFIGIVLIVVVGEPFDGAAVKHVFDGGCRIEQVAEVARVTEKGRDMR